MPPSRSNFPTVAIGIDHLHPAAFALNLFGREVFLLLAPGLGFRPFGSIEEMDDTLIETWNKKISPRGNTVYHLGDFAKAHRAEKILQYRKRLNGKIILIEGTHDNFDDKKACGFSFISPMLTIKHEGATITLCHYALRVWPKSHFDAWHCYGHSHGRLEPVGKSWDVGVDNNGFSPVSFDELSEIMKKQPHRIMENSAGR